MRIKQLIIMWIIPLLTLLYTCDEPIENTDSGTLVDIDGNIYKTVVIGEQTWMAENLKVMRFQNGEQIPIYPNNTDWAIEPYFSGTPTYCSPGHDDNNIDVYGLLYSGVAVVDSRKIAPSGWHIPSKSDWETLTEYLGGYEIAGGKLKEASTNYWDNPNIGATNETGFSALPAGMKQNNTANNIGYYGCFWSSSEISASRVWYQILCTANSELQGYDGGKGYGYSVRCIKD